MAMLKYYEERPTTDTEISSRAEVLNRMGDLHRATGRHQDAATAYGRAISLEKGNKSGHGPAYMARLLGKLAEAQVAAGQLQQAHATASHLVDFMKANAGAEKSLERMLRGAEIRLQRIEKMMRERQPTPAPAPPPQP